MTKILENATIADVGEKAIIEDFLRPLFNPTQELNSVGDDCAAISIPPDAYAIFTTDRVPVDLISFRTGVLGYRELGRYLALLNLRDIAACGGVPVALLFNCALPGHFGFSQFKEIAIGFRLLASEWGANVVGGDISSCSELSLSATAVGYVEKDGMLRRRGARVGDSVFVSRPIGLTPTALDYSQNRDRYKWLDAQQQARLEKQFTALQPEVQLGRMLSLQQCCTSCMDNTDGLAQSLMELGRESSCAFTLSAELLAIDPLVSAVAHRNSWDPISFALGPGADFALVGTLAGSWTEDRARAAFGAQIGIIGAVTEGLGLHLNTGGAVRPLTIAGWNYFQSSLSLDPPRAAPGLAGPL